MMTVHNSSQNVLRTIGRCGQRNRHVSVRVGNAPRQSRQSACSSIRRASSQAGHLPSASGKQDGRQSAGQRVHTLVCTECKASLRTQCVGVRIQPTTWPAARQHRATTVSASVERFPTTRSQRHARAPLQLSEWLAKLTTAAAASLCVRGEGGWSLCVERDSMPAHTAYTVNKQVTHTLDTCSLSLTHTDTHTTHLDE
jgi:hypothetical protein